MKCEAEKSTAAGAIPMKRRKLDIIGDNMQDPFMDSYQEEADTCCDIIKLADRTTSEVVTIVINKRFLRKIVHSHILWIREIEKGLAPKTYAQ